MSSTDIGLCGSTHSDISCQSAKKRTDKKSNSDGPVRLGVAASHISQQYGNDHSEIGEDFPFGPQKSHSAISNIFTDLFHAVCARVLLAYPVKFPKRVQQANQSHGRN